MRTLDLSLDYSLDRAFADMECRLDDLYFQLEFDMLSPEREALVDTEIREIETQMSKLSRQTKSYNEVPF